MLANSELPDSKGFCSKMWIKPKMIKDDDFCAKTKIGQPDGFNIKKKRKIKMQYKKNGGVFSFC